MIDNLEKEDLVEQRPHAKDRRLNLIFLTSKGSQIKKKVIEIANQTLSDATKGIDPENLKIIKAAFLQIYDNLEPIIK